VKRTFLAGHLQSTRDQTVATDGPVLVLHDTTEFSYQREKPEGIGITEAINSGRDKAGRLRAHTVCGILMHSSLAITTEGVPLGLPAIKFWARKKFSKRWLDRTSLVLHWDTPSSTNSASGRREGISAF
jgi:hypothetical protein